MNIASFRLAFPEFSDAEKYPDDTTTLFLDLAGDMLKESIWGKLWDRGVGLFTAHQLFIASGSGSGFTKNASNQSIPAGNPGAFNAPVTSKAVGSVSKSMDVGAVTLKNNGSVDTAFWNMSPYGVQLQYWYSMVGMSRGAQQL